MKQDKSLFSREKVHDTKMRVVIVRLDFGGINDLNDLIKVFDKKGKVFKRKMVMENREINVSFREKDFESISRSLSLPIEAIKSERFVRYEGIESGICDVTLDISQFYLCLTIKCEDNYDGITNYVAPFKGAIKNFTEKFDYFSPKRLGVRKVRVQKLRSLNELIDIYEPSIFPHPEFNIINPQTKKSEYFDVIEEVDKGLRFNIRRELSYMVDTSNNPIYTTTLDIDAYYHEEALNNSKVNDLINYANQREFEIYRECMSLEYLNSISR